MEFLVVIRVIGAALFALSAHGSRMSSGAIPDTRAAAASRSSDSYPNPWRAFA